MKKTLFIIVGLLLLSSCSKEKDCTCEHSTNGVVKGVSEQVTDKECSDLNSTTYNDTQDTTYRLTCTEK